MNGSNWRSLAAAACAFVLAACGRVAVPPEAPPATPPPVAEAPPQKPAAPCQSEPPQAADGEKLVTVYFVCGGPDEYPIVPHPVQRAVPDDADDLTAAVTALLAGPTEQEAAVGFHSWFSGQTTGLLNSVTLADDGHATVNFQTFSHIIPNASTSAGGAMLMAEIGWTVSQFPAVKTFEVQFDGSCNLFSEWQQSGGCPVFDAAEFR